VRLAAQRGARVEQARDDRRVDFAEVALEDRRAVQERQARDHHVVLGGEAQARERSVLARADLALHVPGVVRILRALRLPPAAIRGHGRQAGRRGVDRGERAERSGHQVAIELGLLGRQREAVLARERPQRVGGRGGDGHADPPGVRLASVRQSAAEARAAPR
jgi:hypothetical protein